MVFEQKWTNNLHRQVEKDSKTDAGTENGFHCGKWPKYPFVCFMQKSEIKMRENVRKYPEGVNNHVWSWSTALNCWVPHSQLENVLKIEKKIERVLLGPKWGYDTTWLIGN